MEKSISIVFVLFFAFLGIVSYENSKSDISSDIPGVVMIMLNGQDSTGSHTALGTGFFISDNLIVTNNHVVTAVPDGNISVVGNKNPTSFAAKVVAQDDNSDIALVTITDWSLYKARNPYKVLKVVPSTSLKPGQEIYTIGHPSGLEWTISKGIISGLQRNISDKNNNVDFIQIDANVFPGNSGGPLLNSQGNVIGVNTLALPIGEDGRDFGSYGFSISSSSLQKIVFDLINKKHVDWMKLGITYSFDPDINGYVLKSVDPSGSASKAGFQVGDVIRKFKTKNTSGFIPAVNPFTIKSYINYLEPGDSISVEIERNGKNLTLSVTLQ